MVARNLTEEWLNGRIDRSKIKDQSARSTTYDVVEIYLPFPPSTNNLYENLRRGGRRRSDDYEAWIEDAGKALISQRPKAISGPVELAFYLEDSNRTRGDCTNRVKAPEDLLVSHGVIEGDQKRFVRCVTVKWDVHTKGCRVSIRPAPLHGGGE